MKNVSPLLLILMLGFSFQALAQTTIHFEIKNETKLVVGLTTFHEFDVYMGASVNGTFHSRGQLYIAYNPDAFGTDIEFNGKVTYTELDLMNEVLPFGPPTFKYVTINAVDNPTGPSVAITWATNFPSIPPSSVFHTEVPVALAPLYHISLEYMDDTKPANVSLLRNLMDGQIFYMPNSLPNPEIPYILGSLPVEFLDFTAQKLNNKEVKLDWITATELNNDHFVIEKKVGNGSFQAIGKVDGVGTSQDLTDYSFVDRTPMGYVNTYRLRQVDIDGTVDFSDIVEVSFDQLNTAFTVFPSPAISFTTVKTQVPLLEDYQVTLTDLSGRVLDQKVMPKESEELRIDLESYSEGLYLLRIQGAGGKAQVSKVLKMNQ